jgi:streptomycin 6-kinase
VKPFNVGDLHNVLLSAARTSALERVLPVRNAGMDTRGLSLPQEFVARTTGTFGDAGARWLTELPDILEASARAWHINIGGMYPEPSYQLVFLASGPNGERYALKLGVPRDELRHEAATLRAWAGQRTVKLVAEMPELGALLLERIEPGKQLAHLAVVDDDRATELGGTIFRRLTEIGPVDVNSIDLSSLDMPTLRTWGQGLARYLQAYPDGGPIDAALVRRASLLFASLDSSTERKQVLHGDLHHYNILQSGENDSDWVVIDPKGVIGDPAFEVGAFLRNPGAAFGPHVDGPARTRRRIDILTASSGLDRERVAEWAWAGTVLSAVWCVEGDGPTSTSLTWPLQVAEWIAAAM